jgi:hypothetical protein
LGRMPHKDHIPCTNLQTLSQFPADLSLFQF